MKIREKLALAPPAAKALLIYSAFNQVALNVASPLVNPFLKTVGISAATLGVLSAIQLVVATAASIGGGVIADVFGRRRTLLVAKVTPLLYLPILLVNRSWLGFLIAYILIGVTGLANAPFLALRADVCPDESRGTIMGLFGTVSWVIGLSVPFFSGVLADKFSPKAAFMVTLPLAALAIWSLRGVTDPSKEQRQETGVSLPALFREIWRPGWKRSVSAILLMEVANGAWNGMLGVMLPFVMMDRFGTGFTGISLIDVSVGLGSVISVGVAGYLADRTGRKPLSMLSLLASGILFSVFPFIRSLWQLYLIFFLQGLIGNAYGPAISSLEMEIVGEKSRSTFSGAIAGANTLGGMIGAALCGYLWVPAQGAVFALLAALAFAQFAAVALGAAETLPKAIAVDHES